MIESDADLARLLGVTPAVVCRLKKRGMPTDSLAAATAWRQAHLDPARRRDPHLHHLRPGLDRQATGDLAVRRVHELLPAAESALAAGLFHCLEAELREAMRAVPLSRRREVELPMPMWEAMTSPTLALVREHLPTLQAARNDPPGAAAAQPEPDGMADAEAASMGRFWYSVAVREPLPVEFRS